MRGIAATYLRVRFDPFSEPESCELSGHFAGIFGNFSGQNTPLFGQKSALFRTGHFLHCGTLCAFSRTSRDFFLKVRFVQQRQAEILQFCGIVFFSEGALNCKVFREILYPRGV
jgi:hypothetical protein